MACYITLPDGGQIVIPPHELHEDRIAKGLGQDYLDLVCERLDIVETDYFGLQYLGTKGELLWLNLRNPVRRQTPNAGAGPLTLMFRVKFFVPPHLLLQHATRRVFRQHLGGLVAAGAVEADLEALALLARATDDFSGDYSALCPALPSHLLPLVAARHAELETVSPASADYRFIQHLAGQPWYGVHQHAARQASGRLVFLDVGPTAIEVRDHNKDVKMGFEYTDVTMVTRAGRCVYMTVIAPDGIPTTRAYKLLSNKAANGLYRSITEMHSFYRCDTVRQSIASQCSRDIKGTLASLFNENSELGKKYVFDIQRTCREAVDRARRTLYRRGPDPSRTDEDDDDDDDVMEDDEATCVICQDDAPDVMYVPCGHVSCAGCAGRMELCPFCRAPISGLEAAPPCLAQGGPEGRVVAC